MQNLNEEIYLATFFLAIYHVANAEFRTGLAGNPLGASNQFSGTNKLNLATLGIGSLFPLGKGCFIQSEVDDFYTVDLWDAKVEKKLKKCYISIC